MISQTKGLVTLFFLFCIFFNATGQNYLLNSSTDGTTINTCGGTFYDSGINSNYSNDEDYAITLCSDTGQQIELDFILFDIEFQATCNYDGLTIYDGQNSSSTVMGTFCGTNPPSNIVSSNDCLHIVFSSDYSVSGGGWIANITCSSSDEICNNGIDDNNNGSIDEFCNTCPTGSIGYERWLGVTGTLISDLTSSSDYPNNPSETGTFNNFQGPIGYANSYGTRVQGYLKPTETGYYIFTVTSDDQSQLYLSTDGDPTNKSLIASVTGWTNVNQFTKYATQVSAPIFLYAGSNYYIEMLHKEGTGGDHFQAFWTTPSNSINSIIASNFLSPLECCSVDAGNDVSICASSTTNLNATPDGVAPFTYNWSPSAGLSSASIQNPLASPTTTTIYSLTLTDATGCTSIDDIQVTVFDLPVITITDETICFGETTNVTPTATGVPPFLYSWGGASVSGNTLTESPTVTTTYTVTVTDDNNCSITASTTITVDQLPIVNLSLADIELCIDEPDVILSGGSPTNGTYTGLGVTANVLDVSVAGVGNHTIGYSFTDSNGCVNSTSQVIDIYDLPTVSLNLGTDEVCYSTPSINLSGGLPTGGTYSSPYVTGSTFDVVTAGVGNHTITYTYTDGNGCINTSTDQLEVLLTCSTIDEICNNGIDDNNNGAIDEFCSTCATGLIGYQRWLGVGGTLISDLTSNSNYPNNPSETGTFNKFQGPIGYTNSYGTRTQGYLKPTESGYYYFTVTSDDKSELYLSTDGDPNNKSLIASVTGWTNVNQFNKFPTQVSSPIYLYAGANYYIEMLHKEGSGGDHFQTYWRTPSNSTNTIIAGNFLSPLECCSLDAGEDVSICSGATTQLNAIPDGDPSFSYSWSPSTGLSNPAIQNPLASPTTTTTYTVTLTDVTGCISVDDVQVIVYDLPIITISNENICLGETSNITPTATGVAPFLFSWGAATTSGNTLTVSPTVTTTYTVTVTDDNYCSNTASTTITVDPLPTVSLILADVEFCLDEPDLVLSGGSPSNGTYTGNGITANVLDMSSAGAGNHTITYTYTDGNGCVNSASQDIYINALPIVDLILPVVESCIQGTTINLSGGTPASGEYTGIGVTGTSFDIITAGVGMHTINYTHTDGNGCTNTATDIIEVYDLPVVDLVLSSTDLCISEDTFTLSGGLPENGTYDGTAVTGTNFNPSLAGVGSHTIKYTYLDLNGCENSALEEIVVHDLPAITFVINQDEICLNSAAINLSGASPSGGEYSGPGVNNNTFSSLVAGVGKHTITYTFTDAFFCVNTATQEIEVLALPAVSMAIGNYEFCVDDDPITLSGELPTGGTYTGPGVTGDIFDPQVAGPGIHSISYRVTGSNGCINIISEDVEVFDLPTVELNFSDPAVCILSETFELNEGIPTGGTYTGPGVTDTNFDASTLGVGTYEILYSVIDINGCENQDSDFIVVSNSTDLTFGLPFEKVCQEETANILSGAFPAGGTYSGPGVTAGVFNAFDAGVGFHVILYTYDDGACINVISDEIEVIPTPEVSLALSPDFVCFGEENIILSGGIPEGGNYTGTGVSNGNTFSTYDSGVGSFLITYTYTAPDGCTGIASQLFTVHDLPTVGLDLSDSVACIIETTHVLDGMSPSGGSFSGPGVTDSNFDPSIAGAGDHEISYTYTDAFGCENIATDIISVVDIPSPILDLPVEKICEDETLTLSGGMPEGGEWSGLGVIGNQFDASIAGPGIHEITYNFTISECFTTVSEQITVYALPTVSASFTQTSFCFGDQYFLSGENPTGGSWSGPGVIGNIFNSDVAGDGQHDIVYTYTNTDGCTSTAITAVTVFEENEVELVLTTDEDCVDNNTLVLDGGSPSGGMWFGPGVTGNNFDASIAGLGLHSIFYIYTDGNGCLKEVADQILVKPLPEVTLSLNNQNACPGSGPVSLTGGWPLGGTYTGQGVVNNTIDLDMAGVGLHEITYTVILDGCSSFARDEFEVFPAYNEALILDEDGVCLGFDLTFSSNAPPGGQYQGPGVNQWNGTFSSVIAGIGTHTIYYNFIDPNGCEVQISDELTVYDIPPASLTLDNDRVCATEENIVLSGGSPAGGTYTGIGVSGNVFDPFSVGAGTYTITYSYVDANGCQAEAIDEIIVDPAPSVTYTFENDHCNLSNGSISFVFQNQPDITHIQFSTNGGINWRNPIEDSFGGITYANLSAGAYTLMVRNDVGTCEVELAEIVLQSIDGPTADAGPDVTISALGSTQLDGSGGSFYQWTPSTGLDNTNVLNPTASPTSTTTYILEVTDIYGCVDTDEVTVTVEATCAGSITSGGYPYFEGFESGLGLWSQEYSLDDFDWLRNNGSIASGPSAAGGTWYMMADEDNTTNETAIFRSPCFDLVGQSCAQFTFDYYLANSGSLTLEASSEFGQNWQTIWSSSGNQGQNWQTQIIDLFAFLESDLQLRFVADMGSNSGGSIGIDNVEFITTGCGCEDTSSPFLNFSLVSDPQPFSVDIDCDGDADMLSGGDGQLFFFENNGDGTYTDQTGTGQDIMPNLNFLDMTLGFVDLDNDGDYDLSIVGNEPYNKYFFWNTGTKTSPIFTAAGSGGTPANPISGFDFSSIDGGYYIGYADPTIFWADLDNDDDFDAVVGGKLGWFLYYENIGDENTPNLVQRTGGANPFNGLRVDGADEGNGLIQYESSPLLIDWDGDGDLDLFSGNQISTVQYFENIGTASSPNFVERTGGANPFDGVIFSEDSHLSIIDEDCDGDWDVFYGVGDSSLDAEITMCDLLVAVPNFAQANASQNHFCFGESIFLFEESTVGVSWSWTGPNGFTSSDQDPVLNGAAAAMAGTYTVLITNEQGCEFTSSVVISISGSTADAGPDSTIDLGQSTQNEGAGDGQTYLWSPINGLSDPTVLNPTANPLATTTYTLTVIDEFGCTSTDQMTVYVTTDECTYGNQVFLSDFENTTGDNYWIIGNNASDGDFLIGEPSPYTQSGTTVMEILPQEGDQSLITGNATNYRQDLDGGPTTARSINILLPNDANSIDLGMYWYFSHYINGDAADYLRIEVRDASNGSTLETIVNVVGSPTDRDAVWALANADLSAHAGKTIYIFAQAVDAGNGSKLEAGIDNISIYGTFSTVADIVLTMVDFCDVDSPVILSGGTPEGGVYSGPGVTGNIFNPLDAGPGTHTITYEYSDVNGCIATAVEGVEVYQPPLTEMTLVVDSVCVNQPAIGLFGGIPTGGEWSGTSVVGSTFYPTVAGVGSHEITYTVTDANGCTNSVADEIVVLTIPIITEIISTDAFCNLDNGSITISFDEIADIENIEFSLNGGFTWQPTISDAGISITYTDLAVGTYDLWVRNANGNCPYQLQNVEIENILPPLVDVGADINHCYGDAQTVNPIVEFGTEPITYSWSGPNGFVSDEAAIDVSDAGTYTLIVTDANNCTSTDDLLVSNFALEVEVNIVPIECYSDNNGRILASANGTNPYTYTLIGQGTNGSGVFNGLSQGNYTLEVEDGYGCIITQEFNVPGPPPLTCSQDSCVRASNLAWLGNSNGPWTSEIGSTNVSLSVINESNTDVSIFALDESLTTTNPDWFVESAAGLQALTITPTWDTAPESTMTDIDDTNDDKGTMTFTFNFDEGVTDFVLHVDKLGDFGTNGTTTLSNSSAWTVTTPGVELYKLTGTFDLVVSNNSFFRSHDILHDMASDAAQFSTEGSAAGSIAVYSATPVTTVSFTVTGIGVEGLGQDELRLAISSSVCYPAESTEYNCDTSPGVATMSGNGGVHPYTYEWDNGETTQTAINLTGGNHTVTITDANSCVQVCSVVVDENIIQVDAGISITFCEGGLGMMAPVVSGGLGPYMYEWSGPNGFQSIEENPTVSIGGSYQLTITDSNGCTGSDYVTVYAFPCDQTTNCYYLHEFNNFSFFGSDGTLSWVDYGWDETGDNNSAISGDIVISNGHLEMQNTNTTFPSIQRRVDLSGHSSGILSFDFSTEPTSNINDAFEVEIFDGTNWTSIFTFLGNSDGIQTPWFDITTYISANTEIRFTITSGFSNSGNHLMIDNVRFDLDCLCDGNSDAGIDLIICEGDSIQLMGQGNGDFLWSPAASLSDATIADPMAFPTETTTYQLRVTDEFGCEDLSEITILVNEAVDANAISLSDDFCQEGLGSALVEILQGTGPFNISWTNESGDDAGNMTTATIGNVEINDLLGGETYCIEVLDANGCSIITP